MLLKHFTFEEKNVIHNQTEAWVYIFQTVVRPCSWMSVIVLVWVEERKVPCAISLPMREKEKKCPQFSGSGATMFLWVISWQGNHFHTSSSVHAKDVHFSRAHLPPLKHPSGTDQQPFSEIDSEDILFYCLQWEAVGCFLWLAPPKYVQCQVEMG